MNKRRWMSAAVGAILCLVVAAAPLRVKAATDSPGILLEGDGLKRAGVSKVYYGEYEGEPLYNRVLENKSGESMLLLSEYVLKDDDLIFNDTKPYSNVWEGSITQKWCQEVYEQFTPEEKAGILATTKIEEEKYKIGAFNYQPCSLTGEQLFFLSAKEANNLAYGFTNNQTRVAYPKDGSNVGYGGNWWLRSASADLSKEAGMVDGTGDIHANPVYYTFGGRPAFQIDLTKVLFASPAIGRKAGETGVLQPVGINDSGDWKLTIKDASRNFGIKETGEVSAGAGKKVKLAYTGAVTGSNEYLSALLLDSAGQPVSYGQMKALTAGEENGEVEITIPAGTATGSYTLAVFNEQCNGDKETDYASGMVKVPVEVVDKAPVQPEAQESKVSRLPEKVTKGEPITFTAMGAGMENESPQVGDRRWKPVSWKINPEGAIPDGTDTVTVDTSEITQLGEQKLMVTFQHQRYNGTAWEDIPGDTETIEMGAFTLIAPATEEQPGEPKQTEVPEEPATPSEEKGDNPGTGDPLTLGWLLMGGVSAATAMYFQSKRNRK